VRCSYERAIWIGEILRDRLTEERTGLGNRYIIVLMNFGLAYLDNGRIADARDTLVEAVRLLEASPDSNPDELYVAQRQCAIAEMELENYAAPQTLYEKALDLLKSLYPEGHPDYVVLLTDYGRLHEARGLIDKAVEANIEAANYLEHFGRSQSYDMTPVLNNLGMLYRYTPDFEQAKALLTRALHLREQLLPERHSDLGILHQNLAVILHDMGNRDTAEQHYLKALEIYQEHLSWAQHQAGYAQQVMYSLGPGQVV
jgi:tetratricopeptide (TPR) repeat protein